MRATHRRTVFLATAALVALGGCSSADTEGSEAAAATSASPNTAAPESPAEEPTQSAPETDTGPDTAESSRITVAQARKALRVGGIEPSSLGVRLVSDTLDDGRSNTDNTTLLVDLPRYLARADSLVTRANAPSVKVLGEG